MKVPISAATGKQELTEYPSLERETDVLSEAVGMLRERLPEAWLVETLSNSSSRDLGLDAELRLRAPDGSDLVLLVEVKRVLTTRDVTTALEQLRRVAATRGGSNVVPVLVARYLAQATRDRIAEAGAGYIDATGNLHLASRQPALFLRDRGADSDPWRGPGRPRGTLNGPPAARVVRALIDFAPPYGVPELAKRAGTSVGATYRVIDFLEEQELIARQRRGALTDVRWRALLERWSRDYGFAQSNTVSTYLEPRGLDALTKRLIDQPLLEYAVTGSLAAEQVAPYAPARLAMLYVRDVNAAASILHLRPTTTGANVAIAVGDYDVVFERTQLRGGLRLAAVSQVAVDLLSGPGRNPSEATALLDWMERTENDWRL